MKYSTHITVKLGVIFAIVLCLLIPQISIMDLIRERSNFKHESMSKVASQWGSSQRITGPILTIPFYEKASDGNVKKRHAYFMPEYLSASSTAEVQELEKSIYKIPVFTSNNLFDFRFAIPDFEQWDVKPDDILWSHAKIIMSVSDPKGILENPFLTTKGKTKIKFEPGELRRVLVNPGMFAEVSEDLIASGFEGSIQIKVNGTESLSILPVGQSTKYNMTSNWPHPNFQGFNEGFTPQARDVKENGFTASWSATKFNASLPDSWLDTQLHARGLVMGTHFHQMADHYTKSERSMKYMLLIVGLLFLSFLLSELLNKMRIHPFQYILVGSAVVVFFILLLAVSEYLGYNLAYLTSAVATIGLITSYCLTVFENKKMVALEAILLVVIFTFLFVIINAMEYSLLIGAIGLFLVLAATMYFSRRINWYKESISLT